MKGQKLIGDDGKTYVIDAFADGAVSSKLFFDAMNTYDDFLEKVSYLLSTWTDDESAPMALSLISDLYDSLKTKCGDFWTMGEKQRNATSGGTIDIEELKKRGIPGIMEGICSCSIEGMNPARVLWDAINQRRSEKGEIETGESAPKAEGH